MEELQLQCKEKFKVWYICFYLEVRGTYPSDYCSKLLEEFRNQRFSEKYGVYVDFFEKVDMKLNIHYNAHHKDYEVFIGNRFRRNASTREEARTESISIANRLFNNTKDKNLNNLINEP